MINHKLHIETNCKIDILPSGDGYFHTKYLEPTHPDRFEYDESYQNRGEELVVKAFYKGTYMSQSYDEETNSYNQVFNFGTVSNVHIGDVVQYQDNTGRSFQSVGGKTVEGSDNSIKKEDLPTIYIEVPLYTKVFLEINGVGSFDAKGVDLGEVDLEASGCSRLKVGKVFGKAEIDLSGTSKGEATVCGDADIDASGTSRMTLWGNGEDLRVEANGVSKVNLNYECLKYCRVEASGCAKVTNQGQIKGKLKVNSSGVSKLIGFEGV